MDMTDFIIRKAVAKDAEAIARVHICSWQKTYEQFIPESILSTLSIEERTNQWLALIQDGVTVLVLEIQQQIIGFVSLCEFRDGEKGKLTGEISAIYLAPEYWHQGFGTELCVAALSELSQTGYEKVGLWVLEDNVQARNFYEKLGFIASSETKLEEFYEGGALLTEVLYQKTLKST